MTTLLIQTNTLPEPLAEMLRADRARVVQKSGEIRLIPMREEYSWPIRGMFEDAPLSVEEFMANKTL